LRHHAIHKRTGETDRALINKYILPRIGHLPVADVRAFHLNEIVTDVGVGRGHPIMANRVRALLSTLFNRAIEKELIEKSPIGRLVHEFEESKPRHRFLSEVETRALLAALEKYPDWHVVNAIKLLMTTGARRGEVMAAKWSEFDLESGLWIKLSTHTKTKINQFYELGPEALLVLRWMRAARPETDGDDSYFPALTPGLRIALFNMI
jgi:integrase